MCPQRLVGSLKSFRSQTLQKTLAPNTLIVGPGNKSLPGSLWLGLPFQSCFCAVTKKVLWTRWRAGGGCTHQSQWKAVKNDPNDHKKGKRGDKLFFCELSCADIFFLIYLQALS